MKKLIAYSSVAHMAFVTFGLFAFNRQGIEGAMIVMLSHGLVSGALFLCVGVIYDRLHTREIDRYGGLSNNMPGYALLFMLFTMASVGLPGTSGFVGEFLRLVGTYEVSSWAAIVATTGIILGAAYMLYLYWRIAFGGWPHADAAAMPDLDTREWWLLGADRRGRAVDGRLSRELHARRCAPTSAGCWSGSSAPRRPGDAQLDRRQAAAAAAERHAPEAGPLMNQFAPILPEVILSVGAIVLMLVAAFAGRRSGGLRQLGRRSLLLLAATFALVGAAVARRRRCSAA